MASLAVLAVVAIGEEYGTGMIVVTFANGLTVRAAAGSALYLCLIALLSLGVAAATRSSAVAIGIVLGGLLLELRDA